MTLMPVSKGTMHELSGRMNESVAGGPSAWARQLMEKHGWSSGKGLGKNEAGTTTHVKIVKKDDAMGIGFKAAQAAAAQSGTGWADQWWHAAFSSAAANLQGVAASVAHTRADYSSDSDSSSDSDDGSRAHGSSKRRRADVGSGVAAAPTDAELFAATGGARLGMRARRDQPGKWARAEGESAQHKTVKHGRSTPAAAADAKEKPTASAPIAAAEELPLRKRLRSASSVDAEMAAAAAADKELIADDQRPKKDKKSKKSKRPRSLSAGELIPEGEKAAAPARPIEAGQEAVSGAAADTELSLSKAERRAAKQRRKAERAARRVAKAENGSEE